MFYFQNPVNPKGRLPPTPDYSSLSEIVRPVTRASSDTKCSCHICFIGRMNGHEYKQYDKLHSNKAGRRKSKPDTPPAKTLPLCSKCFSLVSRGVEHVCDKYKKRENLAEFVRTSSGDTKNKVACSVLKTICSEQSMSTSGGSVSLSTGGRSLPIRVGKSPVVVKKPRFTVDSLKRLQTSINLSDRQTL